jgi:hypothetical protein
MADNFSASSGDKVNETNYDQISDESDDEDYYSGSNSEADLGADLRDPAVRERSRAPTAFGSTLTLPLRPNPTPEGWTPPIIT